MARETGSESEIHWLKHQSIGSTFRFTQALSIPVDLPLVLVCLLLFFVALVPLQYSVATYAVEWVGWHGSAIGVGGDAINQSVQITAFVDFFIFLRSVELNVITDSLSIALLLVFLSRVRSTALLPTRDPAALVFGAVCTFSLIFPLISIANAWLQPLGNYSIQFAEWQLSGLSERIEEMNIFIESVERTPFVRTVALLVGFAILGFVPLLVMGTILFITSIACKRRLGGLSSRPRSNFFSGLFVGLLGARQRLFFFVLSTAVGPVAVAITTISFLALVDLTSGLRDSLSFDQSLGGFSVEYVGFAHVFACASISILIGLSASTTITRQFGMRSPTRKAIALICLSLFAFGIASITLIDLARESEGSIRSLLILNLLFFVSAVPIFWTLNLLDSLRELIRAYIRSRQQYLASLNAPWLFLRAFSLDAKMVIWPFDSFRLIPLLGRRRYRLEHILAEAAFRFGPVVAVGNPSDPKGDHGIPREFLSDEGWQPFVEEAIKKYRGTIFLMGAGGYLAWETRKIVEFGAQKRTIFVAPPHIEDSIKYLSSINDINLVSGIPATILDRVGSGDCIAFYWASESWVAILNRRRSAHDYRMAIHKALYDMSSGGSSKFEAEGANCSIQNSRS